MFALRRARLSTQHILMAYVGEDSVSNVWYPIRPRDESITSKYMVYMNSVFGFLNLLGERLETEGLFVEFKKGHLMDMPVPDLRGASPPPDHVTGVLRRPMPRFDEYIEYMARLNNGMSWDDAAKTVIEEAESNSNLGPYSNRAILDLQSFKMLREACHDIDVPSKLYVLLEDEIQTLQQIMERNDEESEVIEDIAEKVGERAKHRQLDEWF
jgi:hypothetical protein